MAFGGRGHAHTRAFVRSIDNILVYFGSDGLGSRRYSPIVAHHSLPPVVEAMPVMCGGAEVAGVVVVYLVRGKRNDGERRLPAPPPGMAARDRFLIGQSPRATHGRVPAIGLCHKQDRSMRFHIS